jgi:hypothetical protein
MDVVISWGQDSEEFLSDLEVVEGCEVDLMPSSGIDGGGTLSVALVSLAGAALPQIVKLIQSYWDRNKNVSVEFDGKKVQLKGVDPKLATEMLGKLFKEDKK